MKDKIKKKLILMSEISLYKEILLGKKESDNLFENMVYVINLYIDLIFDAEAYELFIKEPNNRLFSKIISFIKSKKEMSTEELYKDFNFIFKELIIYKSRRADEL